MKKRNLPHSAYIRAAVLFTFVFFAGTATAAENEDDEYRENIPKSAITLDECISFGLQNSDRMKRFRQYLEESERDVEATKAGLRSYLDLTANLPYFNQEVEEIKDIDGASYYVPTRDLKYQSTLSFHQPLPTSGRFSLNYDFYYHQQKDKLENYSNDLFIRFTQPLFTSNSVKRSFKFAENNLARSRAWFINRQFDFVQDVIEQFYWYYQAEIGLKMQQEEIEQRKQSYEFAHARYKKGELAEYEMLNFETELLKSQALYYSKKNTRDNRASYFKFLIGLPYEKQVTPIADLDYIPMEVDVGKALDRGFENNPDIKSALFWIEWEKIYREYVGTWSEIRGYISITYGLEKIDPNFRYSFRQFDKSRSIMLNVSLPLWDWGRQKHYVAYSEARINSAEYNLLLQQQSVSRTIRNTVRRIDETLSRLNNLRRNSEQAERSYQLARAKFQKREFSGNELILTMQQWTSARNRYMRAFINYEISKAQLIRLTQYDFEKNEKVQPLNNLSQLIP